MPTPTYLFPAVDTHPTYLWHHPCFGTGVMSGTGGKGYKGATGSEVSGRKSERKAADRGLG